MDCRRITCKPGRLGDDCCVVGIHGSHVHSLCYRGAYQLAAPAAVVYTCKVWIRRRD
jgi:hypothetical protein